MFKKQPSDSDRISSLFEKNTIRKTGARQEPMPLSLPDPVDGAPALKPFRRAPEAHGPRPMLLPFSQPDESTPPAKPPSHSIARLNRLYDISPDEAPKRAEIRQLRPETPPETRPDRPAEPKVVEKTKDSPELQSRLRKTQLRLKAVQILLRVSSPLSDRLKEIAGLMCESFSLWQIQIHLPMAHRPEHLEILGSYTRSNAKAPKPNPDSSRHLQKVFLEGRESTYKQNDSQHLLMPLVHRSEKLGVVEAVFSPAHSLSAEEQMTLKTLCEELGFYLAEEQKHLSDRALSDLDTLTGLLNHRAFQQRMETSLKAPKELPISLILIDLDFFRQINEVHGYQQGDQVLQQVARLLSRKLGTQIPLSRFGGEEFAILMPQTTLQEALELAGELRQAIASEKINGKFNSSLGITASLGVANLKEVPAKARQVLLEQACGSLALAKEKGRNQVQGPVKETVVQPQAQQSATAPLNARSTTAQAVTEKTSDATKAKPAAQVTSARKWSEILLQNQDEIADEWERQTEDYAVPEVSAAVNQLAGRLPRLLDNLCSLLDHKQQIEDLEKMPLSYFMPSQVVAEIRRGQHQLISYEVAFMLLQESLLAVLGKHGSSLQDAVEHFFLCVNEKLTSLKTELQKGH